LKVQKTTGAVLQAVRTEKKLTMAEAAGKGRVHRSGGQALPDPLTRDTLHLYGALHGRNVPDKRECGAYE